jgi:hypothetical protein
MARPTKYNKSMLTAAGDYYHSHADHDDLVPTAAGLACFLKVAKSTIYKWGDEHAEFSDMLDAIQAKQERMLASGGLGGTFNAAITRLMLAKHGYSEKQEITGADAGPLVVEITRFADKPAE